MKESECHPSEEKKVINSVVEESLLRVLEAPFSVRESMGSYGQLFFDPHPRLLFDQELPSDLDLITAFKESCLTGVR